MTEPTQVRAGPRMLEDSQLKRGRHFRRGRRGQGQECWAGKGLLCPVPGVDVVTWGGGWLGLSVWMR